ncbi:hypothetical protein KTN05_08435 [Paracoccus sp. Z118]|nr:hypothetical protein [Paracoccus sp. Z118]MBV0891875.1 hypothetical protein [Paracoccus sp. Z118]
MPFTRCPSFQGQAAEVMMDFALTFFAAGYGMCCDRFGAHRMVSVG